MKGNIRYRIVCFLVIFIISWTVPQIAYAASMNITQPEQDAQLVLVDQKKLNIDWEVNQTINPKFNYEINLKDSVCNNLIKPIASVDSKSVISGKYKASLDFTDLSLGTYCINLCIYDLPEIECYNRIFILTDINAVSTSDEGDNSNKPPQITSNPQKLNLNYRENFFYQIVAKDPNGDAFTYRLISAPDFIYLNQKSGFITNTVIMRPGSYFIAYVVIDRNGAYTQQNFTINVFEKYDSNGNPIIPGPTPILEPAIQPVFEIIDPQSGELFSSTNNVIKWNVRNIDFDKIDIYFQKDGGDKTLLVSINDKEKNEYVWNVSGLTNGQYKLILELRKNNFTLQTKEISNLIIGNDVNSSSLLLLNLKPLNQSEITDRKPEISINVLPSNSGKVKLDGVEVRLDNKKITTDCSVNNNEIKCFPTKDLNLGEHTVKMKVTDTNNQEVQQQWTFSIAEQTVEPTPTGSGSQISPSPTPVKDRENFFSDIIENLKAVDMNTWLLCCGGILLFGVGIFIFRRLRTRPAGSYTSKAIKTETADELETKPSIIPADNADELEDFTDYSVGNYSVGEDYEPIVPSTQSSGEGTAFPTSAPVTNIQQSGSVNTPDFEVTPGNNALPDWLKGDSEESSKPVDNQGDVVEDSYNNKNLNQGALVHDDFGLEDDSNNEEEKKKTTNS